MAGNNHVVSGLFARLLRLIFPPRCAFCGAVAQQGSLVCEECVGRLPAIHGRICPLCGREAAECVCGGHRFEFDGSFVPFYYEGPAKRGVRRFKFGGKPAGAQVFAQYAAAHIADCLSQTGPLHFDVVTSVPMTGRELKSRGYNQAEEFANALARELVLPYRRLLKKPYDTRPQRSCAAHERWGNVFGAFEAVTPQDAMFSGGTVLLCDDILTTGATLSECARMLKLAGADKVYCAAAACVRVRHEAGRVTR